LYGQKRLNVKLQAAREQTTEIAVETQKIRRELMKLKDVLHEIADVDAHQEAAEGDIRRRENRFTKRFSALLNLLPSEIMLQYFGTQDHGTVWEELNTSEEHRGRVIEWLDAMISTQISSELHGLTERTQTLKVQDAYRTSKGIAMRRYIDKVEAPQCQIEKDKITEHFAHSWARGIDQFREAENDTEFHLDSRIGEREEEELESFMLDEKNIEQVIRSRQDLSASGVDGISYRIIKAAKKEGVKFIQLLVKACIRNEKIPSSWKEARTILLFKKGERENVENWRPISITNCIYRIFTCLMARSWQTINSKVHLYSDNQKGFIKNTNGCSEHGIILNELLHDASRRKKDLIATAIDFTNAFGSVPHELIMSAMKQRNFPEWTQKIVADMYDGASSTIEIRGGRSNKIAWRRGVKQGCPLSPLLFNLCLEPLLQAIGIDFAECGASVGPEDTEHPIRFAIQAYADDVVFISRTVENMNAMLAKLEPFVGWAQMESNVRKCATASYLVDEYQHRCSLEEPLKLHGNAIPNLTLAQSLKYLGTTVAARRTVKLEVAESKLSEMRTRLQKIMESPLLVVQKIDAVKTFLLPMMDFMLLNGDVGKTQLEEMDKHIRAAVNRALKVKNLPIECHHASWRDGGLSYPSLVNRREVLLVRSFAQMTLSKDQKIRQATRQFAEGERIHRGFLDDAEADFLNWGGHPRNRGTACLAARTRKACTDLEIKVKLTEDQMVIRTSESEFQTKSANGIGHFLTQKIVRPAKFRKLIAHEVHGATYTTLKGNEVSNRHLTDIYSHKSDAYFRFLIVGRADCLPTPANLHRWYGRGGAGEPIAADVAIQGDAQGPLCRGCGNQRHPTLAHILNKCTRNFRLMTERHNQVAKVVREAVIKYVGQDLRSDITENQPIQEEGLAQHLAAKRPDMFFERQTRRGKVLEILEFSCPYGYISHDQATLETVYTQKTAKYQELATELRRLRHQMVNVTAVIVSSMGAIYPQSLKLLKGILECSDRETSRLGKRMSDAAIKGSWKIWYDEMRNREVGVTYGAIGESLIAEETREANALDIIEDMRDEGEEEEEDDENNEVESMHRRDRRGERRAMQNEIDEIQPAEDDGNREREEESIAERREDERYAQARVDGEEIERERQENESQNDRGGERPESEEEVRNDQKHVEERPERRIRRKKRSVTKGRAGDNKAHKKSARTIPERQKEETRRRTEPQMVGEEPILRGIHTSDSDVGSDRASEMVAQVENPASDEDQGMTLSE
jgi:hypothetical protein